MGKRTLMAIDPGNEYSGYVVVEYEGEKITGIIEKGKITNNHLMGIINEYDDFDFAVEMISSYGMAVGAEVFETCVWIGRFLERAGREQLRGDIRKIYRKDVKLNICQTPRAKDSNITQALIDRFAPGAPNMGKGTKGQPGFFYGFKKDVWQAFALAVTYVDTYGAMPRVDEYGGDLYV